MEAQVMHPIVVIWEQRMDPGAGQGEGGQAEDSQLR